MCGFIFLKLLRLQLAFVTNMKAFVLWYLSYHLKETENTHSVGSLLHWPYRMTSLVTR